MNPDFAIFARALFLAAAGLACLFFVVLAICGLVLVRRARARHTREASSAAARPLLHQAIGEYLAGGSETGVLRAHLAGHRQDVADALLLFQSTVGGSARDRLCQLAMDFSLVNEWCQDSKSRSVTRRRSAFSRLAIVTAYEPARRITGDLMRHGLGDPDAEVRLAAARSLLQSGIAEDLREVFELALAPNLLARIVLSEDLRRHAMTLCDGPVRDVLRTEDLPRVRAALEVLVSWERAMPIEDVREFLDHRDRGIRVLAFRLVPLVPANLDTRRALIRALNEDDTEIRTLAVVAVGRLKMTETKPELARCMRDGDLSLARHAAAALRAMPGGPETLQDLSTSSDRQTAFAAAEELARHGSSTR
jgi:hypothetical protein